MTLDVFRAQATYTDYAVKENLADVSHEDSLVAAGEGGNCINWVLGHLVHARTGLLAVLGGELAVDGKLATLYGRGSKPLDADSDPIALEELVRLWDASQAVLMERLDAATPEDLARLVPQLFDATKEETAAVQVATYLFHESYHTGQLGVLRRTAGKAGAIA